MMSKPPPGRDRDPIAELIQLLARLPGVGERTASRFAFHILSEDPGYAQALGTALGEIHERVRRCDRCRNYTDKEECRICTDTRRDPSILCALARVPDLLAMERSGTFRGRYYVLDRLLSPLDGIGPESLPVDGLVRRVQEGGVKEVVVATPLSVEGEATALFLAEVLRPLNVRVSRIASGIPHGGELEFTDQVTLGRAFEGRRML